MANVLGNPTGGFIEFGRMEGGSPTVGMTQCWIASTDASLIFRGDPIISLPSSLSSPSNLSGNYITSIQNSTATNPGNVQVRGIFMGLEQFQTVVGRVVWNNFYNGSVTGSTGDIRCWIIDDPGRLFLIQGSTTNAMTSSFVGLNAGFTANSTTGNTTSGLSNVALQSSFVSSTNALPFRIMDFYSNYAAPGLPAVGTGAFINGTDNTTAANMVIVRMNNCDRLNLTARSS